MVGIVTTALIDGDLNTSPLPAVSFASTVFTVHVGPAPFEHYYTSGGTVNLNSVRPFDGQVVYFDRLYYEIKTVTVSAGATINGLTYPVSDGSVGEVLLTNGSGSLSFGSVSGFLGSVVEDTTPQLGGNLDLNSKSITGTGGLSISGIVTATDFNTSSDLNLKENIHVIENPLSKVLSISGVTFNWKDSGSESAGVIAQEIEEVLPQLVKNSDDGKTVNYNGLIGLLVEAVKDLTREVEELRGSINK